MYTGFVCVRQCCISTEPLNICGRLVLGRLCGLHPVLVVWHCHSGKTVFGSAEASVTPDIVLYGRGVSNCHCYVIIDGSTVTLYPLALLTSVGGAKVSSPTILNHGTLWIILYCTHTLEAISTVHTSTKVNGHLASDSGVRMQYGNPK